MPKENDKRLSVMGRVGSFIKDLSFDAYNTLRYFRHNLTLQPELKHHFRGDVEHPPVVLIQGFLGTSAVLGPLARFLTRKGRNVFLIDLGYINIQDIRQSAEKIHFEIERIMDQYAKKEGFSRVDIVAHSMGGLIALYYTRKLGGHRLVRKLVTLGTPFQGTYSAFVGIAMFGSFSKGVWQMLPRSKFLKELQNTPSNLSTKIYSIAAQYDTISPARRCFLKGAVNRIVPLGHASLLMDTKVHENILSFLDSKKDKAGKLAFEHFTT